MRKINKLGKDFSTFTVAPDKSHIEGTRIEGTRFFVVKATKNATWVKLLTNDPKEFVEGEDYLTVKRRQNGKTNSAHGRGVV
jgi:hypothetical protein